MSDEHTPQQGVFPAAAHTPASATASLFTEAELQAMHHDDVAAARGVVLLMCGVFIAGLILYSIVALTL